MQTTAPSRYHIAIVTYVALVPMVYFIPDLLAQIMPNNKLLNVMAAVAVIVPLVSFLVIPQWLKLYQRLDKIR